MTAAISASLFHCLEIGVPRGSVGRSANGQVGSQDQWTMADKTGGGGTGMLSKMVCCKTKMGIKNLASSH